MAAEVTTSDVPVFPTETRNIKPPDRTACQFSVKNILEVLVRVHYPKLIPLAVELGLENECGEIEAETDPDRRRKRLADTWLRKFRGVASWEVLANALRARTVEENWLALELERWYVRRDSGLSTFSGSSSSEPYSPYSPRSVTVSTEEKVANKMRALAEVDVRDSFGGLVALLASKLSDKQSRNELDIKSFYLYLSSLFPPRSLPNAVDVLLIFQDINAQELWDYRQYETVERIGNRYVPRDTELASAVNEHREMVNNYLATRCIADFIEAAKAKYESEGREQFELRSLRPCYHGRRASKNYYDGLAVTLCDVSIRMKTLKYVRDLWKGIKREFHLPDCNALLDCIYEGSIIIVWLISPSASDVILKPQPWSAIHYIQMKLIVNMTLNENCIYDMQDSKDLLEICRDGSYEQVTSLLGSKDKGAAVNATFEEVHEGKSALMLVCERGNISLLLTVLDGGADVNFQQQTTGQSALHVASKCGHLRVIRFLQAYGADPDILDWSGRTASTVAKEEQHGIVSEELRKGKAKSKIRTQNPLQHASDKIEEFTDFLLAPGLKLYHRAAKRLVGASRSDHIDSVRHIISKAKNLDINIRESDKHGWTALMWATDKGNHEMTELLLENKADTNIAAKNNLWTALMLATRQGSLRIVKALLDHGADPNAQNDKGVSSLSLAVYEHHTEIAMLLVHRGANVNIIEEDGNSPLSHACVENDMELVKLFCDHNANLNHQGVKGWSPLMEAARKGYRDIVEELARRGADLDVRTEAGDSAIHAATVKGHIEVVKVLATYGANLNLSNKDGLTAMMVATDKGNQSIVEVLLEGGADVNYKHQATGWPAIFFAAKNGRVNILKKLLERGANIELETGLKLVDVASYFKRKAIVDEIKKKPQARPPPSAPAHERPLVQIPGLDTGAVGIELTSFTKRDAPVDEATKEETATKPVTERLSPDHDHTTETSGEPEDIEKQLEQLELKEVEAEKEESLPTEPKEETEEPRGQDQQLPGDEIGDTEVVKILKTDAESMTDKSPQQHELVDEGERLDVPKSAEKAPPQKEDAKDQPSTVVAEEVPAEEPATETDVPSPANEGTTTTPLTVQDENDSQPTQSNRNIEEVAKIYEMLFKALDERMNVENVKRSRRKGVPDVQRTDTIVESRS